MLYSRAFGVAEDEIFGDGREGNPLALFSEFQILTRNMGPADTDYVSAVRESMRSIVSLDNAFGGNELVSIAGRVFGAAHTRLASGRYEEAVRRDLEAVVGEAGEVAAWVAYDADRQDISRRYIHEAMFVSRLAGDRTMELFQLSHIAMQSIYLHRAQEALRVAEEVIDAGRLSGRTAALFQIRKARSLAQLGDGSRALSSLDTAVSTLVNGIASNDLPWTWWVDDHELALHRGMCMGDLGLWGKSVDAIAVAVENCRHSGQGRCGFNDHALLLDALVRVGSWRDAEPILETLLPKVVEIGSIRTIRLLDKVATRALSNPGATSTVKDSASELRRIAAAITQS
ncbi:hypothetical protein SAMN05421505_1335 [Sinosporangium album]|uniref:Transcriptional regulator n=1 Tax=Sinosporangium album TaxID=504805 RepID=A0A1G8HM10_9ACTN|nr:hypothetical protein [Sinosporangium album]SDI07709.1 hypothetical protein SAMN05421505_1335 [Sinosporangium album]